MTKEEFTKYIEENYGVTPDNPFKDVDALIFRHKHNRKWFALIMQVSSDKISGYKNNGTVKNLDILDIKTDPLIRGDMLKKKGIVPKCYITQSGPYLGKMMDYAKKHQLSNVEFLGFVDISKLIHLYETCSVYVGCGNYEPWGMRLNDCLLCGAPLIVNRGMGGVKMVDEYDCGLSFNRGDYFGLANAIERLMTDETLYLQIAKNAINAAEEIKPEKAAEKYGKPIICLNEKILQRKRFSLKRRRYGAILPFCKAKRQKAKFAPTRKPALGLPAANKKQIGMKIKRKRRKDNQQSTDNI